MVRNSGNIEGEVLFSIEDDLGDDNDPHVIIRQLTGEIEEKNSGSEAQDEKEATTSNDDDNDSDEWQRFSEFEDDPTDSSDSDWM